MPDRSLEPSGRSPIRLIVGRVAMRAARRLVRDPLTLLAVALLVAVWLVVPAARPVEISPAHDSAEQYLEALRDRDAAAFLSALSPQARRALELRFGMPAVSAAAAFFHDQESRGERVIGWERIGSYQTAQGENLRFYVVHYARRDERRDVPYVLTIDADGKIVRVE